MMTNLITIGKTAWLGLRRQPGFTLLAVLTLAVGIGPATAVYAVFRQVLLRELPVPHPQQLVLLQEHSGFETGSLDYNGGGGADEYFSYPAFLALRQADSNLAAVALEPTTLVTRALAERVDADLVSGNYFSVLGVRPVLGRLLREDDNRAHAGAPVAVLSEAYWKRAFSGNPSILGHTVELNGNPFVIVGVVAHSGIMDASQAQLFVPFAMHTALSVGDANTLADPLYRFLSIIGRDATGDSRKALDARVNTVWWNWRRDVLHTHAHSIPNTHGWMQTHLTVGDGSRGISVLEEQFGMSVLALQAMTALVLLVACSNLANLLLARGARRRGELAVRMAMGAGRARIVTATVAESVVLGLGGAAIGLPLGWVSLRLLADAVSADSTVGGVLQAPWQWPVVAFAIAAALVTAVLFSAGPALAASRIHPADVLRHGAGIAGSAAARLQRLLVAASIALSLLLLAGAVLLGWNLYKQSTVAFGFRTSHLLTFRVDESSLGAVPAHVDQVYGAILAGAQSQPGVVGAAYAHDGLLTDSSWSSDITVEGRKNLKTEPEIQRNYVTAGFLPLLDIPMLRGRDFSAADAPAGQHVAIVNRAFVQQFFHGDAAAALGGHFGFGDSGDKTQFPLQIIGIVPDVFAQSPSGPISPPTAYFLYSQAFAADSPPNSGTLRHYPAVFYIRTFGDPALLAADMHALVHRVDPQLPMEDVRTLEQQVSEDIADIRLMGVLSFALGGLAVLLAAVGLYGVLAYQIATRTREIGVRMALGASRGHVAGIVFRSVCRLTLFGVTAGALVAWAAASWLRVELADLRQAPVWLYMCAAAVLFIAGIVASIVPAQRAVRVDPMEALRTE
jgi:putative ABC transport system permease protein